MRLTRTVLCSIVMAVAVLLPSASSIAQGLPNSNTAYSICSVDASHPTGLSCIPFGGGSCVASPIGFPLDWRCSPPGQPGFGECTRGGVYDARTADGNISCGFFEGPGTCFEPRDELPGSMVCMAFAVTPAITVSPSSLIVFADTPVGSASAAQAVSVTSTGNGDLSLTSISTVGDFIVAGTDCPAVLTPGAVCTARIAFTPMSAGDRQGQLVITHNAAGGVASVGLFGRGIAATASVQISPPALNFGAQYFGTTSDALALTLSNTGSAGASLGAPSLAGPDFAITGSTCAATLAPGASCQITIAFTPYAFGPRVDVLRIDVDGSARVVGVTGGGGNTIGGFVAPDDKNAGYPSLDSVARVLPVALLKDGEGGGCDPDQGPCPPVVPGDPIIVDGNKPHCGIDFPELCFPDNHGACFGNCSADPAEQLANWIDRTNRLNQRTVDENPLECSDDGGDASPPLNVPREIGMAVPPNDRNEAGDPINLGARNKYHVQVDYVGADAYPLLMVRTYNSQPFRSSANVRQSFGPAWTSNLDHSITLNVAGDTAVVTRGDGKSFRFAATPAGNWIGDPDVVARLESATAADGARTWRYTTGTGDIEEFDSAGRWRSLTLRDGKRFTLAYSADGKLQAIVNPGGRSLSFAYDAAGRVSAMTDPGNGVTAYAYDARGRLAQVTYADGRKRGYLYEHPKFAFALTAILDGSGNRYATFTYDDFNRPTSSQLAGGVDTASVAYNADGSAVVTDSQGVTWTRSFTTIQGVVQATALQASCADCPSYSETYTYNALGQVASIRTANGTFKQFTYDDRALLQSTVEAAGTGSERRTSHSWDARFRLWTGSTTGDRSHSVSLDPLGRPIGEVDSGAGQSRSSSYSYDAQGFPAALSGARPASARASAFTFNADGTVATIADGMGRTLAVTSYDAHGRPLSVTYPNGRTVSFAYDATGRLVGKTGSRGATTYAYDFNGQLAFMSTGSQRTSFYYDAAHRLSGKDTSDGDKIRYTRDAAGRVLRVETFDAQGLLSAQSSSRFDRLGRIVQSIGGMGNVVTYQYDAAGNMTQVTDALGNSTRTTYDPLNRPIVVADALNGQTSTEYNLFSEPVRVTDPSGVVTAHQYNPFGQRVATQNADAGNVTYTYDALGRKASMTDARGRVRTYAYDDNGRMVRTTFDDGQGIVATYDVSQNGIGRLASVTDGSGSTSYTYDANGLTQSKTVVVDGVARTIAYSRDALGRVNAVTYPSGKTLLLSHDQGRLSAMTFGGKPVLQGVQYFPTSGPESWIFGNGKEYTRYIDLDQRVSRYLTSTGDRKLTLDGADHVIRIDETSGATSRGQSMTYDALGRLKSFTGFTTAAPAEAQTFDYDANGNRRLGTLNGVQSVYGYHAGSNRLATVTQGAVTVLSNGYDAAGNIVSDMQRLFTYDTAGRMTQANVGGQISTHAYNAWGQRARKTVGTEKRTFIYDDQGRMLGEYGADGSSQEYVWLGGIPVAVTGMLPMACVPGAYSGSEYSALPVAAALEIRGGDRGNKNWETRLAGSVTNLSAGSSAQENWVSGQRYHWQLSFDGAGGGAVTVMDENGNSVSNSFTATVSSGMPIGKALRFRVHSDAELGAAAVSVTIDKIGATVVAQTLTTAANNTASDRSYVHAIGQPNQPVTITGSIVFTFFGAIPTADKLRFLVDSGDATCREEALAYVWTDQQDTPREITDASNRPLWKWDPLPFGETGANEDAAGLGRTSFNLRFAGQYFDRETGLHYNWHRFYDPRTGRYISADPKGLQAGNNPYVYALQDPLSRRDVEGLSTSDEILHIAMELAGFVGKEPKEILTEMLCPIPGQKLAELKGTEAALRQLCKEPGRRGDRDHFLEMCIRGISISGSSALLGEGEYFTFCVDILDRAQRNPRFAQNCAALK